MTCGLEYAYMYENQSYNRSLTKDLTWDLQVNHLSTLPLINTNLVEYPSVMNSQAQLIKRRVENYLNLKMINL